MPNGLLGQLDFEEKIKEWSPPEQFIARQVYQINNKCTNHDVQIVELDERVGALEGLPQKGFKKTVTDALPAGVIATVVSIVVGVINSLRTMP
jgi:hypothetical protein